MLKNVSEFILDGYGSGETDFLTRVSQSSQQVQDDLNLFIIDPLLAVLASTDQTAVLEIQGHSDRVDTEGLSREERRVQELQASADRANSADVGVFQIVAFNVPDPKTFPGDWADLNQVVIMRRVAGGAFLINSSAALTEEQRKQNRRVVLTLASFLP